MIDATLSASYGVMPAAFAAAANPLSRSAWMKRVTIWFNAASGEVPGSIVYVAGYRNPSADDGALPLSAYVTGRPRSVGLDNALAMALLLSAPSTLVKRVRTA